VKDVAHPLAPVTPVPGARTRAMRRWRLQWARRGGLALVTVLLLEYVVVPQLAGARSAIDLLSTVTPMFLVVGLTLEAASLLAYSGLTRCVLTLSGRPSWWTLLRVDLSVLGLSHALPGGDATAGRCGSGCSPWPGWHRPMCSARWRSKQQPGPRWSSSWSSAPAS
jgi:hypothetical protein